MKIHRFRLPAWRRAALPIVVLTAVAGLGCSSDPEGPAGVAGRAMSAGGMSGSSSQGGSVATNTGGQSGAAAGGGGAPSSAGAGGTGGSGGVSGAAATAGTSGQAGSAGSNSAADTWVTYAQGFMQTYCVSCHNDDDEGSSTRDYHMLGVVKAESEKIACGVTKSQEDWNARGCSGFPPARQFPVGDGAKPEDADRDRLLAWIDAGMP